MHVSMDYPQVSTTSPPRTVLTVSHGKCFSFGFPFSIYPSRTNHISIIPWDWSQVGRVERGSLHFPGWISVILAPSWCPLCKAKPVNDVVLEKSIYSLHVDEICSKEKSQNECKMSKDPVNTFLLRAKLKVTTKTSPWGSCHHKTYNSRVHFSSN